MTGLSIESQLVYVTILSWDFFKLTGKLHGVLDLKVVESRITTAGLPGMIIRVCNSNTFKKIICSRYLQSEKMQGEIQVLLQSFHSCYLP